MSSFWWWRLASGGDQDRDLVVDFLASQRISARVVVLSRADYALTFGSARLAVFHVTNRNSVIVAKVDSDVADAWRSPSDSLDLATYLQALVERGISASQGMGNDWSPYNNSI